LEKLIWKHHVAETEIREVFRNNPKFRFIEKGKIKGENVYFAMGQTDSGRYLVVFFICKKDGCALVITARDMDVKERRLYDKK